jgi:hypothetical protein
VEEGKPFGIFILIKLGKMAGGKGREEGKRSFFATCPDNSMISFYINSCM